MFRVSGPNFEYLTLGPTDFKIGSAVANMTEEQTGVDSLELRSPKSPEVSNKLDNIWKAAFFLAKLPGLVKFYDIVIFGKI